MLEVNYDDGELIADLAGMKPSAIILTQTILEIAITAKHTRAVTFAHKGNTQEVKISGNLKHYQHQGLKANVQLGTVIIVHALA